MLHRPFFIISSGQVASLAFLVYDICITLDDEVNTIWSKPNSSWIKWQFLFTRYFALAAQIANRSIESAITSDEEMVTGSLKDWYMCQVVLGSVLMSAVEIVLMARVYALYKKNIWVGMLFVALIVAEMIAVVVGIVLNMPGREFKASNLLLKSPTSYVYFGISAIASQLAILCLTLAKYKMAVQGGWGKVPIMKLMVRDGTAAFFILLVITTMTVVATTMQTEYAPIGNSWFLSIVACSVSRLLCKTFFGGFYHLTNDRQGCRLILNMQTLPMRTETRSSSFPPTVLLTTLWSGFEQNTTLQEAPTHS